MATMRFLSRRLASSLAAACGAAALSLSAAPPSGALTVVPDEDAGVCRINRESSSTELDFWDQLHEDAVAQRLVELDEADPGLGTAIGEYIATDPEANDSTESATVSVSELQQRLSATGSGEGLGMFLPQDSVTEEAGTTEKSEYAPEEARAAASKISDDPSELASQALDAQVSTYPEVGLYAIERDLFEQRREEYNQSQLELRDALNACADEVEPGFHFGLGLQITSIIVVAGMLVLAIVAFRNSRRESSHSAL